VKFINVKIFVGGIFCDLVKAVACVNEERFARQITFLLVNVKAQCDWFRCCLTDSERKYWNEIMKCNFEFFFSDCDNIKSWS
jgi:hypothetical protein